MTESPEDTIVVDTTEHYDCFGEHMHSIEVVMLRKHIPAFVAETIVDINVYHVDKYEDPADQTPATTDEVMAKLNAGKTWYSVPDEDLWNDHYSIIVRPFVMWKPKETA